MVDERFSGFHAVAFIFFFCLADEARLHFQRTPFCADVVIALTAQILCTQLCYGYVCLCMLLVQCFREHL